MECSFWDVAEMLLDPRFQRFQSVLTQVLEWTAEKEITGSMRDLLLKISETTVTRVTGSSSKVDEFSRAGANSDSFSLGSDCK